jgi:hypothetical protein
MIMSNQMLFIGMAGGLALAVGLGILLSTVLSQSTAQMMGGQGMNSGAMGPGMMTTQSTITPWHWSQRSQFSGNGISTVEDVQITGISITGENEITVNLRYDGSETTPSVTVIAITNPMGLMQGFGAGNMGMMGMMQGGQSGIIQPMFANGWGVPSSWQNNTAWQEWHSQMAQWHGRLNSTQWAQMQEWHNQMTNGGMMGPGNEWWNTTSNGSSRQIVTPQSQTGSIVLDREWTPDSQVTVSLEGEGSAYDAGGIHVMVFPLTS